MNPHTTHKLTLMAHNQHIFKAVEVAEFFGCKQKNLGIENAVRVLLYVTDECPECTVTVDNETRVRLLIENAPDLEEFELLDGLITDANAEITQRLLNIRGSAVVYTVHIPGYTIVFETDGPGFTFPLRVRLVAWSDLADPFYHHDECSFHDDQSLNDCECEHFEVYANTLRLNNEIAWKHLVHSFLIRRHEILGRKMGVGPRAGGRIFD